MIKYTPRYPIFIPSKGRADKSMTVDLFKKNNIPYQIVVEPQDEDQYQSMYGAAHILTLPKNDQGIAYSRCWIKEFAAEHNYIRHWQFDDDIRQIRRYHSGKRMPCPADSALTAIEDFTDRYENIGIVGIRNQAFADKTRPFLLNKQVYGCVLINSALPYKWRLLREDTDFSLQVLSGGWCTVLVNQFMFETTTSGSTKGGHNDTFYIEEDGRINAVRELQRAWPHLNIKLIRRAGRPTQDLSHIWRRFTTPLKRKESLDLENIRDNEYGMELIRVAS